MKQLIIIFLFFYAVKSVQAQTLFVDVNNGKPSATGTIEEPLQSVEEAINIVNKFPGYKHVVIKLAPGLYTLRRSLLIEGSRAVNNYSIEALIMPGDTK